MLNHAKTRRLLSVVLFLGLAAIAAGTAQPAKSRTTADLEALVGDLQAVTLATQLRSLRHGADDLPLDTTSRAHALVQLSTARLHLQNGRLSASAAADVRKAIDAFVAVLKSAQWPARDEGLKDCITAAAAKYQAASDQCANTTDALDQATCLNKALGILVDGLDDCEALHPRSRSVR